MDPAGTGLNDPTAAAPVGGNPGTTIGEQRRIAYQFAADLWEAMLDSNVEIKVDASFQPLTCTATSAVLGSAGTKTVLAGLHQCALADTWYGTALAECVRRQRPVAGAGTDDNDITSRFNANLGQPNCLSGSGWYYGLDGNTPAGQINFLDVVMHEIGHGLNFQGFYSLTTGAPFGIAPDVCPDIYSRNVRDGTSGHGLDRPDRRTAGDRGDRRRPGLDRRQRHGRSARPARPVAQAVPAAREPSARLSAMVTASYGPVATPPISPPARSCAPRIRAPARRWVARRSPPAPTPARPC